MKNYKTKILFITSLIVFLSFIFSAKALATTLTLSTAKTIFHQQEQFLVDILLMPEENEIINGFDLTLAYSPNLVFSGVKDGSSVVGLWIEKPTISSNTIHFSGIIPGGFTGLIDPLNPSPLENKKPGILTQLIFSGQEMGKAELNFMKQDILANDGSGTILNTNSNILTLFIDEKIAPSTIELNDLIPPGHFSILLSKNSLLSNGKYVLIFETKDKESGIDYYEVKEPGFEWKKIESPYLTFHQPPVGPIYLKAVDHAGNSTTQELNPNIPPLSTPFSLKILIIFLSLVFILILSKITMKLIKKRNSNML